MEKRPKTSCKSIKIALVGPESTAKTTLSIFLANHYNSSYVPEYAREYIEKLGRKYTFSDVEIIAKVQLKQLKTDYQTKLVFFDTDLIITKVWFEVVYNRCPSWIVNAISLNYVDLYLLCEPDIPWLSDSVRENGGEKRNMLYNVYKNELELLKLNYKAIKGIGEEREKCAINNINSFLNEGKYEI